MYGEEGEITVGRNEKSKKKIFFYCRMTTRGKREEGEIPVGGKEGRGDK